MPLSCLTGWDISVPEMGQVTRNNEYYVSHNARIFFLFSVDWLTSCWLPTHMNRMKQFNHVTLADFPNVIVVFTILQLLLFQWLLGDKKTFWSIVHHCVWLKWKLQYLLRPFCQNPFTPPVVGGLVNAGSLSHTEKRRIYKYDISVFHTIHLYIFFIFQTYFNI